MNLIPLMLAAALSAGNAEFDRTAAEGAATIAMGRVRAELKSRGAPSGVLKEAMLADPAKFVTREEAEAACRPLYTAAAEKAFADEFAAVAERLSLPADFTDGMNEADRQAVAAKFGAAFAAERKAACEDQAKTIVSETRPTEAEVSSKEDWELREMMQDRIIREQKTAVFKENRPYISERIVEPVLREARAEQKRQREYLMSARTDAYAPSVLAAELGAMLVENVRERKAGSADPAKVWGVFPDALAAVPQAAERRALDRLEKGVEVQPFAVEEDAVAQVLAEAPDKHVKAAESERVFRERYAVQLLAAAVNRTVEAAPEAEREEFRGFVETHAADEAVAKSVEAKLGKELLPKWRAVRAAVAEKVAAKTWPTLLDGTWYPDAELADATAARSDYAKEVKNWRAVKGLEALAGAADGKPMMEEADARADRAVAAAFDRARDAIAAQNAIVDGSHQAVLTESRRRKDSFWTRTPDLKKVTELLTVATEERWDETRVKTLWPDGGEPANAAEQHRELFPSVKRKIELLAKVILEEMNQPQPEEKKPEEPPPEETPPEETPEEPPEEKAVFTIEISCGEDAIEITLKSGETTVERATAAPKKDDFENAMYKVTRALSQDILKLK